MSVTGRIIVCLLPSMLCWGGCAAPALLKPKTTIDEAASKQADNLPTDQSTQPSPMVVAEAALIRQIALEKGFAETDAKFYEQSVINAQPEHRQFITQSIYALLNRQGDLTAKTIEGNPAELAPVISSLDSAHRVSRVGGEPRSPDASPDVKVVSHTDHAPLSADSAASQHPAVPASTGNSAAKATEAEETGSNTEQNNASESPSPKTESAGASDSSTNHQKPANGLSDSKTRATHDVTQALVTVTANQQAQLKPAADAKLADADATDQNNTDQNDPQLSWQRQLRLAITRLNRHLAEQKELDPLDESRLRACLGLLQLAAEDPEKAMEALDGLDEHQLEFWRQTIMGLDILMDPDDLPKLRYRVESAAEHLQSGLSTLATLGPLRVSNLAFVKAVRGFGTYDEISPHTFSPGEPVLLYVEFGNFTAEQISTDENDGQALRGRRNSGTQVPMFETVLAGRYDILDQNQRVVMSRTLPVIRDHCRQQRHDFFHAYSFDIPQEIASGYYTIELTIEDKKGDKFGSGTVDLKIR